jgi:hypothetical protein
MEKKRRWVAIGVAFLLALCTGVIGAGAGYIAGSQHASSAATNLAQRSITPTVATSATPTFKRTFSDSLMSGNTNGWSEAATICWFAREGFHSENRLCFDPLGVQSDESVSVDASQISGPTAYYYGIVLHRASNGNEYYFLINSSGAWKFAKSINGEGSDLLPPSPSAALHTGLHATNTLTVTVIGDRFDFALSPYSETVGM